MKNIIHKIAAAVIVLVLITTLFPIAAQAASEPKLNKTKATIYVGSTMTLKVSGASGVAKWATKDKEIATVEKSGSMSGKITAKKSGKTVVTAKVSGKSVKCTVTVKEPYLNAKKKTLYAKDTFQLKLTGAKIKSCTSGNKKVAAVTKKGKVTAKNGGKSVISVKASNGKTYQCAITVKKLYQIDLVAKLVDKTVYVGKTGKINVSGAYGNVKFRMSKEGVAKISNDGIITGLKTGATDIYLTVSGDGSHYACVDYYLGKLLVQRKKASAFGFHDTIPGDSYKDVGFNSRNSDGTNTYRGYFTCDADETWLDKNVSFEVEDVTPVAYKNMFSDKGIVYEEPKIKVESLAAFLRDVGYEFPITQPVSEEEWEDEQMSSSGKYITIEASSRVRVVKLIAKRGDIVLDYIYLYSTGKNEEGEYSPYDLKLYKRVRRKVEEKLWDDEMTNLQKLKALARYISRTTHYPHKRVTSKEYNPTFWEEWSVDGKELFYDMCDDVILNRIMDLQGGIVSCVAADILSTAAQEDLGLPYLYDAEKDEIAPGEGVWLAMGSYSSNPTNPFHESLAYKSADEEKVLLDVQGMGSVDDEGDPTPPACEEHGCRAKIISLK